MKFHFDDIELEIVFRFSYLGVMFSITGYFKVAQQTLAGQGSKYGVQLQNSLYKCSHVFVNVQLDLFNNLVLPLPSFRAEFGGFRALNKSERYFRNIEKFIVSQEKYTN